MSVKEVIFGLTPQQQQQSWLSEMGERRGRRAVI